MRSVGYLSVASDVPVFFCLVTDLSDDVANRHESCTVVLRAVSQNDFLLFYWQDLTPNMGSRKGLQWTIFGLSDTDFCYLTGNISKLVSSSITCQLELYISSTTAF